MKCHYCKAPLIKSFYRIGEKGEYLCVGCIYTHYLGAYFCHYCHKFIGYPIQNLKNQHYWLVHINECTPKYRWGEDKGCFIVCNTCFQPKELFKIETMEKDSE